MAAHNTKFPKNPLAKDNVLVHQVYLDPHMSTCSSVYKERRAKCILRDCLNQMLFTWDDLAMLKGGLTIPATLHEILLHKKRRLLLEPEAYT